MIEEFDIEKAKRSDQNLGWVRIDNNPMAISSEDYQFIKTITFSFDKTYQGIEMMDAMVNVLKKMNKRILHQSTPTQEMRHITMQDRGQTLNQFMIVFIDK